MVIAQLGYSPSQGRNTVLRVTVYPHPKDVLNITEFLHQPETFILSLVIPKSRELFICRTSNGEIKFLFLCAPGHDPQLHSVTIKSIKSPDADPL
jgi:hypothetical protein